LRVNPGLVPGFFTMANMFCGFYSAVLASQGRFMVASWLIVAAAIWDTLDGKLARFTGSTSSFGEQYDSMADVISFGLAPSMLAYFVFFNVWGTTGVFLSFIPLVFASIRLARFNLRIGESSPGYFEGLPSPSAAVAVATFVMFNFEFWDKLRFSKVFLTVMVLVALLMISNIRYEKMPRFSIRSDRANRIKIIMMVVSVTLLLLLQEIAFFPLVAGYILWGPLRILYLSLSGNGEGEDPEPEEGDREEG